ncbi:MAG: carotenoid 1,2-hydratase [Gammaproteobacteria bacterium]|nr:carotenoid 1,2-hydratase [Gammaproteobacteria bacterium]
MNAWRPLLVLLAAALLLAALVQRLETTGPAAAPNAALSAVMGADDTAGFTRALAPRQFRFPADHGAHPDFRSEWWYFTGNLAAPDGRHFGYQLTLFRFALGAGKPVTGSAWRTRDVYMAHFAITDTAAGEFKSFERYARGAAGIAGADVVDGATEAVGIWLDDWRLDFDGQAWRIVADETGYALALTLRPERPLVLQGQDGLSQKSAAPGNASYYYSMTRLASSGTLTTPAGSFSVTGRSWLDREWSTSALSRDQIGWDWFALQLDDGSDLMFYRIRRADGGADPVSAGTLVEAGGRITRLALDDVRLRPGASWTSPDSGASYPVDWRLAIPGTDTHLTLRARLPQQEHALSFNYWEGAVSVSGRHRGKPITGAGYVELTGY